jgi:hypothetical protein
MSSTSDLQPRGASSLDYIQCFDEGCVKTRRNELIEGFIAELAHDDMLKTADKARRAFKPVQGFELPKDKNISEVYGDKARKLAEKVLEQERQNYVDGRAEKDQKVIEEIKRKLRFMVWTVNEEGQLEKLKIFVERVTEPNYRGDYHTHDIQYVGDRDKERLRQISMLRDRLERFRAYVPYYSEEIKKLYEEAMDLASLEVVRKEG